MRYTEEMMMHSSSGYSMPFEEVQGKSVELLKPYSEENHGIDFKASHYPLAALATGVVSAIGTHHEQGVYMTIRYGKYEVTYSGLSNLFVAFGQNVRAGQTVAVSGDALHMEVSFDGKELNPIEFLTMLYGNIKAMQRVMPEDLLTFEMTMKTDYEKDKEEIEQLMLHFLPVYFEDLQRGVYSIPEHTEQSLSNVFSIGAQKNYFFENIPGMQNPLGIGQRAMPLACKVQNLLIADFLNYLALHHNTYLSSMSEAVKKKPTKMP